MTGRVIAGRYSLQQPIGRGAMGVVWRARDQLLDREVAVKEVVITALIGDDERQNAYQRTLREARTAARLSHRGVVAVYDVAEEDGRPWIIMELVEARALDQVLTVEGRLSPLRAGRIGQQLLAALAHAHAAGVLHRDVKPSNVLVARERSGPQGWDERAVLTDFGIAQFEGDPRLTQTGMVMGSPGFTAPERIRGGKASPASDLWSLGATLYTAVEGRGPYESRGGPITTMSAIIHEDAPVAAHAGRLGPLIGALLRRDPATRPSALAAARMFADVLPLLTEPTAERSAAHPPTIRSAHVPAPPASASVTPAAESRAPVPPAPVPPAPVPPAAIPTAKVGQPAAAREPGKAVPNEARPGDAVPGKAADADAVPGKAAPDRAADADAVSGGEPASGDSAGHENADVKNADAENADVSIVDGKSAVDAKGAEDDSIDAEGAGHVSIDDENADAEATASTEPEAEAAESQPGEAGPEQAVAEAPATAEPAVDEPAPVAVAERVLAEAAIGAAVESAADAPDSRPSARTRIDREPLHQQTVLSVPVARPAPPASPKPTFTAASPADRRAAPSFSAAQKAPPAAPPTEPQPGYGPGSQGTPPPSGAGASYGGSGSAGTTPYHGAGPQYAGPSAPYPDIARQYQPGTGGGRAARPRRRGRTIVLLAAAIVLAAVIGAVAAVVFRNGNSGSTSTANTTNTTNNVGNTPLRPTVAALDDPSDSIPNGWQKVTITPAMTGTTAGFSIGLPPGWNMTRSGLVTYLKGPDNAFMDIDLTAHTYPDMVAEARFLKQRDLSAGRFPQYHEHYLIPQQVRGTAGAFWQFTWVPNGEAEVQSDDILFINGTPAGSQSYAIYFRSPNSLWNSTYIPVFKKMLRTFHTVPEKA